MAPRACRIRAALSAVAALCAQQALGGTFTVTNFFDSGSGSLREALNAANSSPGADTIVFNFSGQGFPAPPYTMYLNSPLPTITGDVNIVGPGYNVLTITRSDTASSFGLLQVTGAASVRVEGLWFLKGASDHGGGLKFSGSGSLTIHNSVFSECSASLTGGAVSLRGAGPATLTITDSFFLENGSQTAGGALCVERAAGAATTSIHNCAFNRNAVKQAVPGTAGGAVHVSADATSTFTIERSTFSSNSAPTEGNGGGVYFSGAGGTLNATNCTFASNTGGDGSAVSVHNAAAFILHCTITGNNAVAPGASTALLGSGTSTFRLVNTIAAGNTVGTAFRDLADAQVVTGNNNLIGVGSTLVSGVAGNIKGVTDPKLAPINTIGGITATLALRPDSPALDAGSNADAPGIDQRGQPRPADGDNNASNIADIGAFETQKFVVSNVANAGAGSLRQAIADNNLAGGGFVRFAIGAQGSRQTIALTSQLPLSAKPLFLDGWSQGGPAYVGPPLIEVSGQNLGTQVVGLDHWGSDSIIRGLAFNSFRGGSTDTGWGMVIRSRTGIRNWVYGCYFGVALDGVTPKLNDQASIAIYVNSNANHIGTNGDGVNDAAERNIIGGSSASGVRCGVYIGSNSNVVAGNYIGLVADGSSRLGQALRGVWIDAGAANNRIGTYLGDASPAAGRNLIAGCSAAGVLISSGNGAGNSVTGNHIGLNAAGNPIANAVGVQVTGSITTVIGGDDARLGNVISGNSSHGVVITGAQSIGCVVQGNFIGLNPTGLNAIPNAGNGVLIQDGASFTRVGMLGDQTPTDAARRNVISGNAGLGVLIRDAATTGTQFMGNVVGADAGQSVSRANSLGGVRVLDCAGVQLIENVISGNSSPGAFGVELAGALTTGTVIRTNRIGTDRGGSVALGNAGPGVLIRGGASQTSVGGTARSEGNLIVNNGAGIVVLDDTSLNNTFLGNSIHSNAALGIDLSNDGVTPNGPANVVRIGPNRLTNAPFIHSVTQSGVVTASLTALASRSYRIEFFSSPQADASGYGEGRTFLGFMDVATDASGQAGLFTFSITPDVSTPFISATATELSANSFETLPQGSTSGTNTSEFSNARRINNAPSTQSTSAQTPEDTDVTVTLSASDSDAGTTLTTRIRTLPIRGTLLQFGTLVPISAPDTIVTDTQQRVLFRPAADAFGSPYATFTYDADDGVEPSSAATVTLMVTPVADTPSVTDSSTVQELQTTSGLVITRNPADGSEVTHMRIASITGGALFLNDGITPVSEGSFVTAAAGAAGLRFTPAASFTGTASFRVRASIGSTLAGLGGSEVTAHIAVTPNARTPVISSTTTLEDTMSSSGLVISPAGTNGPEVTHFKIVSLSKGRLFRADGVTPVDVGSFIPVSVGAAGLRYRPELDDFGSESIQVSASLSASDSGIANAPASATVTVTPVNDPPSFTASNPPTALVLGAPVSIANWAAFSPGPANESDQTVLAYEVSAISNASLFSALPAVSPAGTLTYTPAPSATGTSTFTVRVRDSGGTANNGIDLSAPQTFTITVLPINQPPSFVASDPPAVLEGSGIKTVLGFVSSFSPGPPEDSGQRVLEYLVDGVSNPSLFSIQPVVTNDGNLTYTLSPAGFGTSTFRVRVRDDGGTDRGGQDTSDPHTFTIIVRPIAVCQNVSIDARTSCASRILAIGALHRTPAAAGPGATQSVTTTYSLTQPFPIGVTNVPIRVSYSDGLTSNCVARVTVLAADCNSNGVPDSCDIASGTSPDCNADGVPDECQCIWDNGTFPTGAAAQNANGQLSHLGGGIPEGAKVADDFYLPPGPMYRIFGFTGAMFTNTLPSLRKARLEFYEDCDGMPAFVPFKTYTNSVVIATEPGVVGFDMVTYNFDFCNEPLTLDGDRSYWVSLIGITDNQGGDSSYWVSTTAASNPGGAMGSSPKKTYGLPGSTWGNFNFDVWTSLDECCLGCVNFAYRLRGEACPLVWDNGQPDATTPAAGVLSGTDRGRFPPPRAADNFVIKPCTDVTVCHLETFIYTNCNPPAGFVEIYANDCRKPVGAPLHVANATKAIPTGRSTVVDGISYPGYRLIFENINWTLPAGKDYWISSGSYASGGLNLRSFFAFSADCNRACLIQISPGVEQSFVDGVQSWMPTTRDFAFRVFRKPDPWQTRGIPSGGNSQPTCPVDLDRDGLATVQDIFEFLSYWFANCQ